MLKKVITSVSLVVMVSLFVLSQLTCFAAEANEKGKVIFNVEVPGDTPLDTIIYVSGDTPELGNLSPVGLKLAETPDGTISGEIELPVGKTIRYRYTRGDEATYECAIRGEAIELRTLTVTKDTQVIEDVIAEWDDMVIKLPPTAGTIEKTRNLWIDYYNNSKKLEEFYMHNSILITDSSAINNAKSIGDHLKSMRKAAPKIKSSHSLGLFEVDAYRAFDIGYYETDKGKIYYVSSLTKMRGSWYYLLHALGSEETPKDSLGAIDKARKRWMELANGNNHLKLVQDLYVKDCYYFTPDSLAKGQEDAANSYAYMSEPGFSMTITAEKAQVVNEKLAFEIGRYVNGDFKGLYTLIWKKDNDGVWKVLLDFNF